MRAALVIGELLTDLGAGVQLLMPEDNLQQLGGYVPGQAVGGLTGYLQTHAAGAVQIEDGQPIASDGLLSEFWCAVACLSATAEGARVLTERVRLLLCGDPVRDPGRLTLQTPDTVRRVAEHGAYMCRPTFRLIVMGNA